MKKMIGLMVSGLAISGLLTAQTLNVQVGNVLYQFPAAQTAQMPYENGSTLTVMGKVFNLNRKLDEWQEFCRKMYDNLPYAKELIYGCGVEVEHDTHE